MEFRFNTATGARSRKINKGERRAVLVTQSLVESIRMTLGPNSNTSANVCDRVVSDLTLILETCVDQPVADEADEEVAEAPPEAAPVPKTNGRQKVAAIDDIDKPEGAPW